MSKLTNIFHLWQPQNDYNLTNIYGKLNVGIDWFIFGKIAEGKIPMSEYVPLQIRMQSNKILKHDLVTGAGDVQIFSQKAVDIIGEDAVADFLKFPVFINTQPYFAFYPLKKSHFLDVEKTEYTKLNIGDDGFWEISKHVFDDNKILKSACFCMPQTNFFIYCTGDIGQKILDNELGIMAQPLVEEVADVRKRVVYDNPVLGISFTEPKNWRMEGTVYDALKSGKKMSEKSWQSSIPDNKLDIILIYMQRFKLLKDNSWLNKASISINLTRQNAADILNADEKHFDIQHPEKAFEGRINEGGFYITLFAPYNEKMNFDVRIVSFEDDKSYLEEAKNVFRNIHF